MIENISENKIRIGIDVIKNIQENPLVTQTVAPIPSFVGLRSVNGKPKRVYEAIFQGQLFFSMESLTAEKIEQIGCAIVSI